MTHHLRLNRRFLSASDDPVDSAGGSETSLRYRSAAGYQNYQQWLAGTKLQQQVSLEDYSVSNRGLRSGLVGTPEQVAERIAEFEAAGVDLLLLQCSPQLEEMERFAETIIRPSAVATAA